MKYHYPYRFVSLKVNAARAVVSYVVVVMSTGFPFNSSSSPDGKSTCCTISIDEKKRKKAVWKEKPSYRTSDNKLFSLTPSSSCA